ncbi:hypothetical protein HAZT_HAZT004812 [Hyalella azteca]|uniref:2-amino-3-carboxymuconate-6-semialdehyde decarboxylase n=1 Tax=Hyalella azteca TaxID=294128 RepID=A0A6A0HCS5_HYAAZ|nr:hypothetical protein HAZT_HAZT004812 [Hyalella azteca]
MSDKPSPAVDLHTHILPPTWPDLKERYGYGGFVQLQPCTHARPGPSAAGGYVVVHDLCFVDLPLLVVGEDRVVLGSDYPFPLGEHVPGQLVRQSSLPQDVKSKILFTNAMDFLGLDSSMYT